jgi:hypothetical protein
MYRQPDRINGGISPGNSVAAAGRYHQVISGFKPANGRIAFKLQTGCAGHKHHPFVVILVVPLAFG